MEYRITLPVVIGAKKGLFRCLRLRFAGGMSTLAQDRWLFIRFAVGAAVFLAFRHGAVTAWMSTLFRCFGHYSSPPCRLDSELAPLISDIRLGFDMSLPTFLT
jgi:hypothetical protein